ncbi:MAG: hypothetical protein CM15mP14_0360 [Rhodospirillaceae bacterium]|nr:MAG: hypothetical protein CM15mP14_0360 [Rhodospirillaceae bacterium]
MAASMTFDMGNTDKLAIFRQELKALGIEMLQPDINRSGPDFRVEEMDALVRLNTLRPVSLKNVGGPAMEVLEQERICKRAVLRFV